MGSGCFGRIALKIGVGVEGPSDLRFWNKVLHKHIKNVRFDIRNMKSRSQLIRQSSMLYRIFKASGYQAFIIILDKDKDPCNQSVFDLFASDMLNEARKPIEQRFLYVYIADRGLESWILADPEAVRFSFPDFTLEPGEDTCKIDVGEVKEMWKTHFRKTAFSKNLFAEKMSLRFDPKKASAHSKSFSFFWKRIHETLIHNI